jgi:di/tricarboxylate transporter
MIVLAAFNVMSMHNAALLGGLALLLNGSMTPRTGWQSIEWDTVVILGAAVGLSTAVTATGLSDIIAQGLTAIGGSDPYIDLVLVFCGCILLTNIITNAAAVCSCSRLPCRCQLPSGFASPPSRWSSLGRSYTFINPAGYQTNLMVQKPGNYTFLDFAKLGIPLTILVGIIVLLLTPLIYQFTSTW